MLRLYREDQKQTFYDFTDTVLNAFTAQSLRTKGVDTHCRLVKIEGRGRGGLMIEVKIYNSFCKTTVRREQSGHVPSCPYRLTPTTRPMVHNCTMRINELNSLLFNA